MRSLRAAIDAKCRECLYDPDSGCGPWRMQVDACTSPSCPLYPVRPRSRARQEGPKTGTRPTNTGDPYQPPIPPTFAPSQPQDVPERATP